jgi:hypothetical protein
MLWEQEVAGSNPATPTKEKVLHKVQDFFIRKSLRPVLE